MLPPVEFRQALNLYEARAIGMFFAVIVALFATLLVAIGLVNLFGIDLKSKAPPIAELSFAQQAGLVSVAVGCMTPGALVLLVFGRRVYSDRRLRCPICKKHLAQHSPIVIASHNCPHCGQRVLSEPNIP